MHFNFLRQFQISPNPGDRPMGVVIPGLAMAQASRLRLLIIMLVCASLLQANVLSAEQVAVRHTEGVSHGFLALRSLDGKLLADGELTQVAEGDHVTGRVVFRFKDGSIYDDTTTFSQRKSFRLLT